MKINNNRILVIAPHLKYPLRNGADIAVDRKWKYISIHSNEILIYGCNEIVEYSHGLMVSKSKFENKLNGNFYSAIKAIIFQTNYLVEKFNTRKFTNKVNDILKKEDFDLVVFSFISSTKNINFKKIKKILIETHNNEFQWYDNISKNTFNPFIKILSKISKNWINNFFIKNKCADNIILSSVSKADFDFYLKITSFKNIYIPAGTDVVSNLDFSSINKNPYQLIFFGSLSVRMNLDALYGFEVFYRRLVDRLGNQVTLVVAGSNPSKAVIELCNRNGWKLHQNIPDDEMDSLISSSLFSVMPFDYGAGMKLKYLKSLSLGVPCLSFGASVNPEIPLIYPSLVSNDSEEWINRIETVIDSSMGKEVRKKIVQSIIDYSWDKIALDTLQILKS